MLNMTAAPSAIVEAIQATGRDAILRGSGASDSECLFFYSCPMAGKHRLKLYDVGFACKKHHY